MSDNESFEPRAESPSPAARPQEQPRPQPQADAAPGARRRARRHSRRSRNPIVVALSGILSFLFLAALAAGGALYLGKAEFESAGPLEESKVVMISRGQGVQSIARQLEREGVIGWSWMFVAGVGLYQAQDRLQAGEYEFEQRISMRAVMDKLVSGKALLHALTVPEGLSSKQIVALINANEVLTGTSEDIPREGSLLPETYKFTRGSSRAELLRRMRADLNSALEEAWASRDPDLPLTSALELLTLASIVEKETGKAAERPHVAGVFVNRLRRGMKLQSDPTILYGLYGGDAWARPRTITRSELDAPNDYSTYQIDGLPPGPIANVGRASLMAVANPMPTNDLFFVADGTGGHAFAETLEEHNRNVAKWREIERQRANGGTSGATQ